MNPGDTLAERFVIDRLAGTGGMGAVYKAKDRVSGDAVALKLLQSESGQHSDRFEREARVLAELRHPRIVRYVAHGAAANGKRYLAMEWLDGEDLSERLGREGLSGDESAMVARHAAEALAEAHARGIVHRDIKPSNLFLPGRDLERLKVLDFGIARLHFATRAMTRTGMTLGTPGYMAPEQARGDRDVGPKADVFALGCVLFECLTGRPPFMGEHMMAVLAKVLLEDAPRVRDLRANVPPELDSLVARMLAKDPAQRPADARAVATALEQLGTLSPVERTSVGTKALAITTGEQRLLSVVVARGARVPETAEWAARTMTPEEASATRTHVFGAIASYGPKIEWLADGSVIATLSGKGGATEQAAQAARCALAMRAQLQDAPMALATGRGNVGGALPVGEVIDRAARMLEIPSPHIRIDDVTAGLLDTRFDVGGDAAGLALRGEREVVETVRTLLGKPTPCVGRERELSMIDGIYAECVADPVARAVLVTAPAGVGKTRIASEFLRKVAQGDADPAIWVGRGDPMSAGAPFGIVAQALRRAAGLLDGEPVSVRQKKLRARVARHVSAAEQARVAEFLGELVGTPFPDDGRVQLRAAREDPMLLGDQTRRAFEDFLAAECAAHPVVLVLEDLQWGDLPTVKLVDHVLRKLHDQPFMVLALARPDVQQTFPNLWAGRPVTQIQLSELSKRAAEKLVRQVLGDVTPERLAMLIDRAAGNAFYLEELIRAVASGNGDTLPGTVLAMVQGRLEALAPEARRVLRAASVFGQMFWSGGVAALLGGAQQTGDLAEWLVDLTDRELVERRGEGRFPGQPEFTFRHALVREAAYAMLTAEDRALGHQLAGEWLEAAGEQDAMTLAEHFDKGEQSQAAARWYERAAEQALGANDMDAAAARAERGVACGADGELRGRLRGLQAEARLWAGDYAGSEIAGLEAMELLPRGGALWFDAAGWVGTACGPLGHTERLVAIARELHALGSARIDRAAIVAIARATMQVINIAENAVADALIAILVAPQAARFRRDPNVAGLIDQVRSAREISRGDHGTSLALTQSAVACFEQAGNLRDACYERLGVVLAYMFFGAWPEAQRELVDLGATAERYALTRLVAMVKHNLGLVHCHLGLPDGAAIERGAIADLENQGDRRLLGCSYAYLAQIHALGGDLAAAEQAARTAVATSPHARPVVCLSSGVLAQVLLAAGRTEEAAAEADRAFRLLEDLGSIEEGDVLIRLVHAETVHATRGLDAARPFIHGARDRVLSLTEQIRDPHWRASFLANVPENARTLKLAADWR